MRVGVLGATGPAGGGLALRLASVGYEVIVGSRSADRGVETAAALRAAWPDLDLALGGGTNDLAAEADVVVIATPWDSAASTAVSVADALADKLVISMANALARVGNEFQPLIPPRGSVAAMVQAAVPRARVAGAFHHLPAHELADLAKPIVSDVLICSDHPSAIRQTAEIAKRIPGVRPLQVGSLSNASAIEGFTTVLLQLNVRYKTRSALQVTGIEAE